MTLDILAAKMARVHPAPARERVTWDTLRGLAAMARPHARNVAAALALDLAVTAASASVPFALKQLVSSLQAGNYNALLWIPALAFVVTAVLGVGRAVQAVIAESVVTRVGIGLQRRAYDRYLALEQAEQFRVPLGEQLNVISQETMTYAHGLNVFFTGLALVPFTLAAYGTIMLVTSWKLTLAALLTIPVSVALGVAIGRRLLVSARELQNHQIVLSRHLIETLGGLLLVKVFNREPHERERFSAYLEVQRAAQIRSSLWSSGLTFAVKSVNAFAVCVVAWIGFYLLTGPGGLGVPDLVKFTAVLFLFHGEILKVATGFKVLSSAAAAEERLRPVWAAAAGPATAIPAEAPPAPPFRTGLFVAGASTGYVEGQPVLAGTDFEIRPGERIALCGPSGAGKTTLVRLLLGLLPPWQGSVTLDGAPVGEMNPAAWRRHFSVAPQDPLLFNLSIRENIAYGKPGAGDEEVRNAARLACADGFIRGFPRGYDTPAGESGGMMSEGQRQRIAIARALLRDAPILVLDEPCSNLDARTEREIYANLAGLSGRTIVLISHRLGAVARADRIYYVDGGRIACAGTHAELLQRSPEYRSIFALQAAWEADLASRAGTGENSA